MKHIILIEDDDAICDSLTIFFETISIRVTCYDNGGSILSNNFPVPDLFLIDKQLRGVDGIDICKYLKSLSHTSQVPAVMMSASPAIVTLAKLAGADDVLIKPFKMSDLKRIVEKFL